jgi:membrane associated rhomboid family serine protease
MRLHWIELLTYFCVSQSGSGACFSLLKSYFFHPFQEHKITLHVRIFGILLLVLVDFGATLLKT